MKRPIVFTDLDGTLLDHETYSFEAALGALSRLKQAGIPVILASSKTAAEIVPLQKELDLANRPAIVENGAGILWPGQAASADGQAYDELRARLDRIDPQLRRKFEGFGDWNISEVARRTGLDPTAAARAKRRQFSEPGIFTGSPAEREAFVSAVETAGLQARMGGRFLTISAPSSKAECMRDIIARLFADTGGKAFVIALGDAPNDIEMLEAADIGIVVANPAHAPMPELAGESEGHILRTVLPGPAGWAEIIDKLLDDMAAGQ